MFFRQVFDDKLAEYAYIVGCQKTGEALVIDPQRDIDRYVDIAREEELEIVAVTETHIHADFLSGAREFADQHGVKVYLSDEGDENWKYTWPEKGDYDVTLLKNGDTFWIGNIEIEAVHTPGHTPEHLSFLVTDHGGGADEPMGMATGDFVFVGDLGRPDLLETAAGVSGAMEPSARRLYESATEFLKLPDYLQVWPGHGAGSACGKALGAVPESTVGYERRFSPALQAVQQGEREFVDFILTGQPEPPVYFARMKKLNKIGAPVLGGLPRLRVIDTERLASLVGDSEAVVLDTRAERDEFYEGHLPGSIYAPISNRLSGFVGSYVDPEQAIYLIAREEDVEEAVRNLIRIGYDKVVGFATPETLAAYAAAGGELVTTETIDFAELERRRSRPGVVVLDVRGVAEYELGHLDGAVNVAHTRLSPRLDEVPTDRTLLLYCETGGRVSGASSFLQSRGYTVVAVDDDYAAWTSQKREGAMAAV